MRIRILDPCLIHPVFCTDDSMMMGRMISEDDILSKPRRGIMARPQVQKTKPAKPGGQGSKLKSKPIGERKNQTVGVEKKSGYSGKQALGKRGKSLDLETLTETQSSQEASTTVSSSLGSLEARVTKEYARQVITSYPVRIDYAFYSASIYPAGHLGSALDTYFQNSIAPRVLTDIRNALSYGPASALTAEQLAAYINTVFAAYYQLKCVRHIMNYCYNMSNRQSLLAYFNDAYDYSVADAALSLSRTLDSTFLPPKLVNLADQLARVYAVDETPECTNIQIVPWNYSTNSASDFVALMEASVLAINGLTNLTAFNTAFSSTRYAGLVLPMASLQGTGLEVPEQMLGKGYSIAYSNDMLDVWSNLPLEAANAVPSQIRHAYANNLTTIYQSSFGSNFSMEANAIIPYYNTSDALYQPGILEPYSTSLPAGENNFGYLNQNGNLDAVSITSGAAGVISVGVITRATNNVYDTTTQARMIPPGAVVVNTNGQHKLSDAKQYLDALLS